MVVGGAASFVTARDMFAKVLFREIPMQSQGPGRGKAEKDAWLWCLGETMAFLSEWIEEVVDRNSSFIFGPSLGFGYGSKRKRRKLKSKSSMRKESSVKDSQVSVAEASRTGSLGGSCVSSVPPAGGKKSVANRSSLEQ
jgi:hypothetical protein